MSAFVVSDRTMQQCVSALTTDRQSCEDADQLGRDLYRLNVLAVNHRYRDSRPEIQERMTDEPDAYAEWRWKVNNVVGDAAMLPENRVVACQQLKALHCLRYQMSEGEEVPASALYHDVERRTVELARQIVSGLPEYDKATWD